MTNWKILNPLRDHYKLNTTDALTIHDILISKPETIITLEKIVPAIHRHFPGATLILEYLPGVMGADRNHIVVCIETTLTYQAAEYAMDAFWDEVGQKVSDDTHGLITFVTDSP